MEEKNKKENHHMLTTALLTRGPWEKLGFTIEKYVVQTDLGSRKVTITFKKYINDFNN